MNESGKDKEDEDEQEGRQCFDERRDTGLTHTASKYSLMCERT
jgi:hypothetical protein